MRNLFSILQKDARVFSNKDSYSFFDDDTYVFDMSSASEMTGSPSTSSPLLEGRNSCLRITGRPFMPIEKLLHSLIYNINQYRDVQTRPN